jgi:pimeloyl-ACP methyl ester carboxylesterase
MNFLFPLFFIVIVAWACLALFTFLVARRIDAAFPATGQWIEVEGERLHYRSLGHGPAVVLVHGLGGESRNFDYLPLEQLAQHWRLVLVDRPGAGHSPRRDDAKAGIAAQARIIASFIEAMHFEAPPLLVGHSLGGAIALSLALQQPQRIAGIGLIAPLTHFNAEVPAPFRAMAIRKPLLRRLFARTLAAPLGIVGTRAVMAALFGPDAAPADFGARGGGFRSLRPDAFCAASTDMAAVEQDLPAQQQRYGELRLPVRILYGEGDRVLDWRAQGEALRAKVPQAQLKVIAGGHMIPVTHAAETAAWLQETARAVLVDLCNSSMQ